MEADDGNGGYYYRCRWSLVIGKIHLPVVERRRKGSYYDRNSRALLGKNR